MTTTTKRQRKASRKQQVLLTQRPFYKAAWDRACRFQLLGFAALFRTEATYHHFLGRKQVVANKIHAARLELAMAKRYALVKVLP